MWPKSRYTVNGENCLEILLEVVVPQLQTKPNFDELFFQQDGASPHYALRVRDYLNVVFSQRWFAIRDSIEWPPRSLNLTPMDFLGGVVKNKAYNKPKTTNELKDYIYDAFRKIDENRNLRRTVCPSVLDRGEKCCNVCGGHFEHLEIKQFPSKIYLSF